MKKELYNNNKIWMESGAKWITYQKYCQIGNVYLRFVKDIVIQEKVPMLIRMAGISKYELYINGEFIIRGPAAGDIRYAFYHEYMIPADKMLTGVNRIAILLFHEGKDPDTAQKFQYYHPGLLVWLSQGLYNCVTDKTWKVSISQSYSQNASLISKWGSYKQYYHGDKEEKWQCVDFDISDWDNAIEYAEAVSNDYVKTLAPLDINELESSLKEPVRIVEVSNNLGRIIFNKSHIWEKYSNPIDMIVLPAEHGACPSITFDFGSMVVGYPEIQVAGAFCIYEVYYGETLDLYRLDIIRKPQEGLWKSFQRRAFRFMQVKFIALEGSVTLKTVKLENSWYSYNNTSIFNSDNIHLNKMVDISKHTLRMNTSFHFEDCPWREQALWIFDMRIMAMISYYNFGNAEIVRKCLRQSFALQDDNGNINSTGPWKNTIYLLDFIFHLIGTLKEYYCYTGDIELVKELLPYAKNAERFVINNYLDTDGLMHSDDGDGQGVFPCGIFLDWSSELIKEGKPLILNALFLEFEKDMDFLDKAVGFSAGSRQTGIDSLQQTIFRTYYDAEKGVFKDALKPQEGKRYYTFQGNVAATYAGIPSDEICSIVLKDILNIDLYPAPFGPSYYFIAFEAFFKYGKNEEIWNQIKRYWSPMIHRGATTWWEAFDLTSPEWSYPHTFLGNCPTYEMDHIPISSCHGWSGIPGYAIQRYILGINLMKLYRNEIEIKKPLFLPAHHIDISIPCRGQHLKITFDDDLGEIKYKVHELPEGINLKVI